MHIHSKYSIATSRDMEVETLGKWAKIKGIKLLGTGDFTHPLYFRELQEKLAPKSRGLYKLKNGSSDTAFMLTAEISSIYSQGGRVRKVHTLIFAPSLEIVAKINMELAKRGNIASDGRPILGLPAKELVKIVMDVSDECMLVPAHAWTPWFSVFGAKSGFDSLQECFEEQSKHIYAIETGLSSDPAMNWRISALDKITLISNSDAHSPSKLGREANIFDCALDYYEIIDTIKAKDNKRFLATIEFFPQEGKYYYDGHRNCRVSYSPKESLERQNICPVCGKKLTGGVLSRINQLADRPEGYTPSGAIGVKHLVALAEIIAEVSGCGVNTKKVRCIYQRMIESAGSEFNVLLDTPFHDIDAPAEIVEAIKNVREGKVALTPGYDGEYGKISIPN